MLCKKLVFDFASQHVKDTSVERNTLLGQGKMSLQGQGAQDGPLLRHTTQHPLASPSHPTPGTGARESMLKPIQQIQEAEQLFLRGTTVPAEPVCTQEQYTHPTGIAPWLQQPTCGQQGGDYACQRGTTASW